MDCNVCVTNLSRGVKSLLQVVAKLALSLSRPVWRRHFSRPSQCLVLRPKCTFLGRCTSILYFAFSSAVSWSPKSLDRFIESSKSLRPMNIWKFDSQEWFDILLLQCFMFKILHILESSYTVNFILLTINQPVEGSNLYFCQPYGNISPKLYFLAPSLALETVTGINKWAAVWINGAVCIFYTSIGGLKG